MFTCSSSLPVSLPFPLRCTRARSPLILSLSTSFICHSTQTPSNYEHEESRWLREEQRWLREEQRWLREEQRWIRERKSLIQEIQILKSQNSQQVVPDTISSLLQIYKDKNRIPERSSSGSPFVLENNTREAEVIAQEKEVIVTEKKEVTAQVKEVIVTEEKEVISELIKKRKTLKVGSEGEQVKAMQEALLRLGFYCGEEDMEFSSFSSGTARAVKTWQASIDVIEDGVMTSELLEKLFMDHEDIASSTTIKEEGGNGAVVLIKDESDREVDVTKNRVFLLGENRWEDPSRLVNRSRPLVDTKTRCITCRGEGQLLCLECDGTGEPNIEPQFMEWIGEDTKCAYCEGLGYSVCDVCGGKTVPK